MGVKKKVGKQRMDKFYKLAKETGYRSRAAFKLIQLNRKFSFLEKSRVCIDLCAAPGGWMQVARKTMPVSSVVIGVDLVPIQAVPGCIGLTGDITTEETVKKIQAELKTWKADIVLNDGAPNIGANWLHDAYAQICLALSALKLATKCLRKGGWFITKVFRSKDYNAYVWVLKQFFQKVHATKPSASRVESAEIFIVCQGYIAPDHIDPKLLDPTHVFEDMTFDSATKSISQLLHPEKLKKPKATGYTPGDYTHHKTITAKQFIDCPTALQLLVGLSEIKFEDDEISNHPRTTSEIKECCKDLKVLGRKDIRAVLAWWKAVREDLIGKIKVEKEDSVIKSEGDGEKPIVDEDEKELAEIDEQIKTIQEEEKAELKRKRKKATKQRQKLQEKLNLKMIVKDDAGPIMEGDGTEFSLRTIKSPGELTKSVEQSPDMLAESEDSDSDEEIQKKYERYVPGKAHLDKSGMFYTEEISDLESSSDDEEHIDMNKGLGLDDTSHEADLPKKNGKQTKKSVRFADVESDDDDTEEKEDQNPIVTDLDYRPKRDKRAHNAALWFEKESLKDLTTEADEDYELDQMVNAFYHQGGQILGETVSQKSCVGKTVPKTSRQDVMNDTDSWSDVDNDEEDNDDDDSDDSDHDFNQEEQTSTKLSVAERAKRQAEKDGFEVVPKEEIKKTKKLKLDEEGLAVGAMMVSSAKTKRDLIDGGWNKWVFNDVNLPSWFVEDEEKHMKKNLPVPEELIKEYKKKMQEINVRPIKSIIEAKARKKRRALKRLENAKKRVQSLMDNVDISSREKARQIKKVYQAAKQKRKEVTYVIAKKDGSSRKMKRPPNVKGPYKVVDPRMKKDARKQKLAFKKQGSKGKSTKPINHKAVAKMKKIQRIQNAARKVHTA